MLAAAAAAPRDVDYGKTIEEEDNTNEDRIRPGDSTRSVGIGESLLPRGFSIEIPESAAVALVR